MNLFFFYYKFDSVKKIILGPSKLKFSQKKSKNKSGHLAYITISVVGDPLPKQNKIKLCHIYLALQVWKPNNQPPKLKFSQKKSKNKSGHLAYISGRWSPSKKKKKKKKQEQKNYAYNIYASTMA